MSENAQKYYVTTPIYYVNARPHIGHAYTTIVADVLARRHRIQGDDTFFLTGTDEHGQKIERSAAAAGIAPQQFADQVSAQFEALWKRMGITNNRYIRTTDERHKQGVQKLFRELYDRGFIYLDKYTGAYCVSDETFVDVQPGEPCPDCGRLTEQVTEENFFFKLSEFQKPLLDLIESNQLKIENESRRNEVLSFLRGDGIKAVESAIAAQKHIPGNDSSPNWLLEWGEKNGFIGRSATNQTFYKHTIRDLSVSRSSFTWGIPVPEDVQQKAKATQKHVVYVWLDALANYMTAIGYGSDAPVDEAEFKKFWPADLHLVGKEIIRFHCVYWPAFLLAAGLPLPKAITAHGWLLFDNAKMSKSKGNIVRTETILDAFGTLCPPQFRREVREAGSSSGLQATEPRAGEKVALAPGFSAPTPQERDLFASDVLRYFLLREIPFGQDGSFNFDALVTRYNADLANGYGNLVSRTLSMIDKYFEGRIPTPVFEETAESTVTADGFDAGLLSRTSTQLVERVRALGETDFAAYLAEVNGYIATVDGFITANAPWKLAKDPAMQGRLATVLYVVAEAVRCITIKLHTICPFSTARVWTQLGFGRIEDAAATGELERMYWGGLAPGTALGALAPVFPRADKTLTEVMLDMENERSQPSPTTTAEAATTRPDSPLKSAATPAQPAPVATDPTHPAAPPRALDEPAGTLPVAGSIAVTTERTHTPHADAQPSGVFASKASQESMAGAPADGSPQITIDDFAKVELRVAQIIIAERIPKADKLLRLEVDLGYEKRQILSGIAEWYTPEDLVGRRIVVITNLAPRKMRGLESHGMLLAASEGEGGKPVLATFGEDVALGSRLK